MSSQFRTPSVGLILLLGFIGPWRTAEVDATEISLSAALDAMQARQDAVASVVFEFEYLHVMETAPQLDSIQRHETHVLKLQGDWTDFQIFLGAGQVESLHLARRRCFDGLLHRTLSSRPGFTPQGIIDSEPPTESNYRSTHPLMLMYRPFHPRLGNLDRTSAQLGEADSRHHDSHHVVLKWLDDSRCHQEIWLDPSRDFAVMRYAFTKPHSPANRVTLDIQHERDATDGWIPAAWQQTWQHGTDLSTSTHAKVTRYTINRRVPNREFQIKFPFQTSMIDNRQTTSNPLQSWDVVRISSAAPLDPAERPEEPWLPVSLVFGGGLMAGFVLLHVVGFKFPGA